MNPIYAFLTEIAITFAICYLVMSYFHPFLHRILVDLCGTEDRAQFWTAFCNVLLLGLPIVFSLGYHPNQVDNASMFFDMAGRLSGNLITFLFTFFGIGGVVSFFALVAPKTNKIETK